MAETTATTNPRPPRCASSSPRLARGRCASPAASSCRSGSATSFLYLPILVVVIMSFNDSENLFVWRGFSLRWYPELFADEQIMQGLGNTLIVATGATAIATVLGTLLAYGIQHYTRGGLIRAFAIAPAILPDLLLGIGLLTFFSLLASRSACTR